MDVQPCAKKKKNSIIALFNLDITDSVLGITFGMPMCASPYPNEWKESNVFTYVCLTICKISASQLSSFLR